MVLETDRMDPQKMGVNAAAQYVGALDVQVVQQLPKLEQTDRAGEKMSAHLRCRC